MPIGHYEKKIDQLELDFLITQKNIESLQQATKREASLRVAIQGLSSWIAQIFKMDGAESPLYLRAIHVREQLEAQIRFVSTIILNSVNQDYETNFRIEEILSGNERYYYQYGIIQTLQRTGKVNALYQKRLEDIIPAHPKDEYPLTRQMKRIFYIHAGPTNDACCSWHSRARNSYLLCGKWLAIAKEADS